MYIFLVSVIVLLCVCARNFLRKYFHIIRLALRMPTGSGALPLIGHLYKISLCYDNEKLLELLDQGSRETNEAGGFLKFWAGPLPFFVISDPEDIQKVMNSCIEKNFIYSFADKWIRSSLLLAPSSIWKSRVKIVQPAFTPRTVLGFLEIFNEESRSVLQDLYKHVGLGPFQHYATISHSTMKSIFRSAFGLKLEGEHEIYRQYQIAHENVTKRLVKRFRTLWFHLDFLYQFSAMKKEEDKDMRVMYETTKAVLQKAKKIYSRRANNPDEIRLRPFLEALLQKNIEGSLSDDEIQAELSLIIGAAYETTSLTMTLILVLLGSHPEAQEKLHEELERVFGGTDRDVTKEDLPDLVYLEAVIKEALRLYPTIPAIARETDKDVQLKNYTVPSGSNVGITFWGMNRYTKYWGEDVEEFRPERWLNSSVPNILCTGASFGLGKRGCIGKIYAMMSMKTSLAHILRRYKISASKQPLKFQMNIALHTAKPVSISIDLR